MQQNKTGKVVDQDAGCATAQKPLGFAQDPLVLEYKCPFMSPHPRDVQIPFPVCRESGGVGWQTLHG